MEFQLPADHLRSLGLISADQQSQHLPTIPGATAGERTRTGPSASTGRSFSAYGSATTSSAIFVDS